MDMKSSPRWRALLFLVAPLLPAAIACEATTASPGGADGGADATADATADVSSSDGAATDSASDAGTDLYPADTTKIVVTEQGGFVPSPPDGSVCSLVDATYTLLLPSRELSWKVCEYSDSGPYAYATGQKTLSAAEFAPLSNALHGLRRATQTMCGADAPSKAIVFTAPAGDTTYYDDFYFCDPKDSKPYVTGLDAVLSELQQLAK